mmetsp:Transcript_68473/g.135317  ORF Transcript_68473/g.135317 Transcript_68473/m.135317 type:complete len:326 (-) Transcript_68473:134-1111(-)|eukprot:CAMPEP_0172726656 /NCGR_PEP_ID=MMETSP1074-20121228/91243_1 /TAXON_ID=2916 /ORGANISM="Ceratium fusus, Strain PA161109" /LENGTH=325 /DNA_ID=CAMNT_0013553741 /DNA_START=75 /DNA_END=1052 /DNA_ORIENTATION=-
MLAPCHAQSDGTEDLSTWLVKKQSERSSLHEQLLWAQAECQQLRLRLHAVGLADPSLVPTKVSAGSGLPEPPQLAELRSLLRLLAERTDLTRHVVFDCGGEVLVGGRRVVLRRMATWQLAGSPPGDVSSVGSKLKLSVPVDMQAEISHILLAAREHGGVAEEALVQRLAEAWELVGTEVVSAAMGRPEPAIFLVHRHSAQAMTLTEWPAVDFTEANIPGNGCFDANRHFARLVDAPPLVRAAGAPVKVVAPRVGKGDRVEVECEGQWLLGTLQEVDGDVANIRCDTTSPGVITVAPLTNVRPVQTPQQEVASKKGTRRMRARSSD